jgi:ribosomal protein S6--L-glutamate ligase
MANPPRFIALEKRLKECRNVLTLGVRPNFSDYTDYEQQLIRLSSRIYFPSILYADLFNAMGKETFPSHHTYKCVQDKIKQTAVFNLLKIPHPRTRVFYGNRSKQTIKDHFSFPFIGKIPRGSAMGRGVFLIRNNQDLEEYCNITRIAYIQEYLPADKDIRVVVIGRKTVLAYWRIAQPNDFRTNVALGGTISFDNVPQKALDLALDTAINCGWDDVGIDIMMFENNFFVIEANMKYGKAGFLAAGIDYIQLMEKMLENGDV